MYKTQRQDTTEIQSHSYETHDNGRRERTEAPSSPLRLLFLRYLDLNYRLNRWVGVHGEVYLPRLLRDCGLDETFPFHPVLLGFLLRRIAFVTYCVGSYRKGRYGR
jgi:hypothetical protein